MDTSRYFPRTKSGETVINPFGQVLQPTVLPYENFNADADCDALKKAMKGLGTDENAVIEVVCNRSWEQRTEIEKVYKAKFGKDLEAKVKSETSGNFHRVLKRLLRTPTELAAYELRKVMERDAEDVLIDTICTKTTSELEEIKQQYLQDTGRNLEDDVKAKSRNNLLLNFLKTEKKSDSYPDWIQAAVDSKAVNDAVLAKSGADVVDHLKSMLCSLSYSQLQATFVMYHNVYKARLIESVERLVPEGSESSTLLKIMNCIGNISFYFASRLNKAMKGAGTNDETLLRIIVARCDFDLTAICEEYQQVYGRSLASDVESETSGDYRKALLALIA